MLCKLYSTFYSTSFLKARLLVLKRPKSSKKYIPEIKCFLTTYAQNCKMLRIRN